MPAPFTIRCSSFQHPHIHTHHRPAGPVDRVLRGIPLHAVHRSPRRLQAAQHPMKRRRQGCVTGGILLAPHPCSCSLHDRRPASCGIPAHDHIALHECVTAREHERVERPDRIGITPELRCRRLHTARSTRITSPVRQNKHRLNRLSRGFAQSRQTPAAFRATRRWRIYAASLMHDSPPRRPRAPRPRSVQSATASPLAPLFAAPSRF